MYIFGVLITLLCLTYTNVYCKYLDGLDRSFDVTDNTIVNIKITITPEEYQQLLSIVQVSGSDVQNGKTKTLPDFDTKTASIYIEYNGEVDTYDDISFKTGGMYARCNDKVGFNIKIDDKFLGRKSIRLRPDAHDRSHLRQKVVVDILNRAGLPSIQSTFAKLTINDQFFGLYTLMDSIKPFMVRKLFNVKNKEAMVLYQCKYDGMNFKVGSSSYCINANTDNETDEGAGDMQPLDEFINAVAAAKTINDLEAILDVDEFLKYIAIEWLIGSFDHLMILGHNFDLYKKESDGKWVIMYYDFDNTFGHGLSSWFFKGVTDDQFTSMPIKKFDRGQHIIQLLVHNDDTRFKSVLKDVLVNAYNPTLLNLHIDDLKSYISSAVKEDLTPVNGSLPGRINKKGFNNSHSYKDYEMNSEYSKVNKIHGIKQWIKERYESACKLYSFDPNEIESLTLSQQPISFFTIAKAEKEASNNQTNTDTKPNGDSEADTNTNTLPVDDSCWSSAMGYSCCQGCNVLYTDKDGKWGVENGNWCGISTNTCQFVDLECSASNQYKCCSQCEIDYVDGAGRFGYENGEWCNIPFSC